MSISLSRAGSDRAGFHTIAAALRRSITSGDVRPNEQLLPIGRLARSYGATAITVRRALRLLEEEGLVRVAHGVGTFVADWSHQFDMLHLPSFSAEMAAGKLRSETEVCGREAGIYHPAAAAALGLQPADAVARLTRLRRVEDTPIVFQHSYVQGALGDVVTGYQPNASLYGLLRAQVGRVPVSATETLRAVPVPAAAAARLEVAPGSPGWLAVRTTFDAAGAPLLYDEAYFAGARVELRVQRRGAQSLLHYAVVSQPGPCGPEE